MRLDPEMITFLLTTPEGVGTVRVTFKDGSEESFKDVRYDANRVEQGFLTMETTDGRIHHLIDARSWEVVY